MQAASLPALIFPSALPVIATAAAAQPHEVKHADFTLRRSTVASGIIDKATAQRHGRPPEHSLSFRDRLWRP